MKLALVSGAITSWLAGEVGVSERVHSSAADLSITGNIIVDPQGRVRAASMRYRDRKNLAATVSFTTTRKFATTSAAEEWSALYDAVTPRTGYLDLYGANEEPVARLTNAVVSPPTRTVNGVSVNLAYQVVGGAWLVPDASGGFDTPEITMGGQVVTMGN